MSRSRSPPTFSEFTEIYIDAIARVDQKVRSEDEKIRDYQINIQRTNDEINTLNQSKEPNAKRFVLRIVEINGVYCNNPIFEIRLDSEFASINFEEFAQGDVVLNLTDFNSHINVNVIDNQSGSPLFTFDIVLSEFENKSRQEREVAGPGTREPISLLFEGQLIYSQQDYLRGHLFYFNSKLDDIKQNRYEYNEMRQQLMGLFKDQQLNAEINKLLSDTNEKLKHEESLNRPKVSEAIKIERNSLMASVIQNDAKNGLRIIDQDHGRGNNLAQSQVLGLRSLSAPQNYDPFPSTQVAWNPLIHILFYVNIGVLAASFFVNWHRASFLSLIVGIIFCTWYLLKEDFERLLPPIFMLVGYLLALTFDLVWLFEGSGNAWNNGAWVHSSSLAGMDKFMVVMSYVLVGFEGAAVALALLLQLRGIFAQKFNVPSDRNLKPKI
jgi:hypothetical protein